MLRRANVRLVTGSGKSEATFGHPQPKFSTHSFGCHFVEVTWQPAIARLRVGRVVTVIDAGRISIHSPICPFPKVRASDRAGDVLLNETVRNVMQNVGVGDLPTEVRKTSERVQAGQAERRLSFADPEKNLVFEQLERMAAGADFDRYRGKWLQRVRDFPGVVREAIGDVKIWQANPRNKLRKPAGALIFQRARAIAKAAGKDFRFWLW